jgi:hypothetical protein
MENVLIFCRLCYFYLLRRIPTLQYISHLCTFDPLLVTSYAAFTRFRVLSILALTSLSLRQIDRDKTKLATDDR